MKFLFLLFCLISTNALSQNVISYYPDEFYRLKMNETTQEVDRKYAIRFLQVILRTPHLRNPGGLDELANNCRKVKSKRNCYFHRTLKYSKEVRPLVMGYLHAKPSFQGNKYEVETVYCHKKYLIEVNSNGGYQIPDHRHFNVEHTMPKSRFNRNFNYEKQKSDMHNLFPTVSRVNSLRSSHHFAELAGHRFPITNCTQSEFLKKQGSRVAFFEPPKEHKGNVARTMAYFALNYDISLSPEERRTYYNWSRLDPVDASEIKRNIEVYKIQNNRNPFVDFPHLMDLLL